ncbi:TIGR01777 family oxidoreductase [Bacillus suaedaesalsae]|uniref:TIGR01777 family oxidoreductase n=1 Tax=Bacillus suaedaesalsae TaxID=2810349 RepID=A0ABS2DGN0_9BACI|nr:TIGR01777 family oxidoreductase [Bacillus suaedaesalsae]MBM6616706.1 TIGR01777 family oxidoreductase [Bacillus suaedaesalsae]
MTKKVVLAGGTGFIGQYFEREFSRLGYEVKIISRQPQHIPWDDEKAITNALEKAEILINLAGKSVNCRYNDQNKKEIMNSRTETTTILGNAIQACQHPPQLWVNSSTATIYRHAEDRPMTEEQGEIGTGFSVDVAKAWEDTFFSFKLLQTRQVALRIAIVLGPGGGVMTPYMNLVKYGLGGVHGSGKQMFSWIHVEDLFNIVLFLQKHNHLSGVFNCSAPVPVSNRELMKTLREKMNMSFGLPAMKWMLEIGALCLRTETELVLKSRWVLPERLKQEGFEFTYKTLDHALDNILTNE